MPPPDPSPGAAEPPLEPELSDPFEASLGMGAFALPPVPPSDPSPEDVSPLTNRFSFPTSPDDKVGDLVPP